MRARPREGLIKDIIPIPGFKVNRVKGFVDISNSIR